MAVDFESQFQIDQGARRKITESKKQNRNVGRPVPDRFKKKYEEQKAREEKEREEKAKKKAEEDVKYKAEFKEKNPQLYDNQGKFKGRTFRDDVEQFGIPEEAFGGATVSFWSGFTGGKESPLSEDLFIKEQKAKDAERKQFSDAMVGGSIGYVPIAGTVYHWDNMSNKQRSVSIALDAVDLITPFIPIRALTGGSKAINQANAAKKALVVDTVKEFDNKLGSSVNNVATKQENYANELIKYEQLKNQSKNLPSAEFDEVGGYSVYLDDGVLKNVPDGGFKTISVPDLAKPKVKTAGSGLDEIETTYDLYAKAEAKKVSAKLDSQRLAVLDAENELLNAVSSHAKKLDERVANVKNLPIGEEVVTNTQRSVLGALDTSPDLVKAKDKVVKTSDDILDNVLDIENPSRSQKGLKDISDPLSNIKNTSKKGLDLLQDLGAVDENVKGQITILQNRLDDLITESKRLDNSLDNPADVFDRARVNDRLTLEVITELDHLKKGDVLSKIETIQTLDRVRKNFPNDKKLWSPDMYELQKKLNFLKFSAKQDVDAGKISPYDFKVDKTKKFGQDKPDQGNWYDKNGGGGGPDTPLKPLDAPTGGGVKVGGQTTKKFTQPDSVVGPSGQKNPIILPTDVDPFTDNQTPQTTTPTGDPNIAPASQSEGVTPPSVSGLSKTDPQIFNNTSGLDNLGVGERQNQLGETETEVGTPITTPITTPFTDPETTKGDEEEGKGGGGPTGTGKGGGGDTGTGQDTATVQGTQDTNIGEPTKTPEITPVTDPVEDPTPDPKPIPEPKKTPTDPTTVEKTTAKTSKTDEGGSPKLPPRGGPKRMRPLVVGARKSAQTPNPRTIGFRMGKLHGKPQFVVHNLRTKKTQKLSYRPDSRIPNISGKGSAKKSFTVIEYDNQPSTQSELDLGAVASRVGRDVRFFVRKKRKQKRGKRV
jgi:hypothetical protein